MPRRVGPAVALIAAVFLSSCTYLDEILAPKPEEPPVVVLPEPEVGPVETPPVPPKRPRPPTRTARLPAPADRPQPAPVPPTPQSLGMPDIKLVGVSRAQAESLFGAPVAQRDAAPAKVWQYRSGDCEVDLYFYLDVARNDFYALHYDVRNESAPVAGEGADRCVQRIYSERHR